MKNEFGRLGTLLSGLALVLVVAACAPNRGPTDARLSGPTAGDLQRILATPRPPAIITPPGEVPRLSQRSAARLTDAALSDQRGARRVEIASVPLLRSTPAGATFLAMTGHRALAQGEPAASCPALVTAPPNAPDARTAALAALAACGEQLALRGTAATCGCRLIALDDALLAPIERFAFAPAVSALLNDNGRATRLIAEAELINGAAVTRLRNANAEVGVLRASGDNRQISGMIDGVRYAGTRTPFGFRRGRLAERVELTSNNDKKISLLIGVERRDATK
ncbi:MAG: hypothetical protein ACPGVA_05430 [Pikeienuella sp.]